MTDEPDFEGLAKAWIAGDPRLQGMDPERARALAVRLAEALDRRRRGVAEPGPVEEHLVVNVHPSRLDPEKGLDPDALDQLTEFVEEAARELEDEE